MDNNAQRSETVTLYAEEYQYGIYQMETLLMLMSLLQTSDPDALDHESVACFAQHARDILTTAREALNNPIST